MELLQLMQYQNQIGVDSDDTCQITQRGQANALLDWISRPCEDRLLGQKILTEMANKSLVVNYNC